MTGQLAAIDEVIATIESQDKQLAVIDRIAENGMSTGSISRNDRRLLAADNQARKARLAYKNATQGIQTESETPTITDVDQLINSKDFIFALGKKEDPTKERVGSIQDQYYHIFPDGTFEKINVDEAALIIFSKSSDNSALPPDATANNSTNTEQNINQDKPSDDTGADVTNDPAPTTVDLISGSNFAGMSRVLLGNNRYRFGDDPTIYEMVTRPNAAGQPATFYKKVN